MNFKATVTIFLLSAAWAALWALGMPADDAGRLCQHIGFAYLGLAVSLRLVAEAAPSRKQLILGHGHTRVRVLRVAYVLLFYGYIAFAVAYPFTF